MSSVTLVSKDSVEFSVEKEVALISPTLKAMLGGSFLESNGRVELLQFPSPVLAVVIDYLNYYYKYKDEDPTKVDIPNFDVPTEMSLELLLAADYLNI